MIYYFKPFDTKKRLGHIHNKYCKLVPNANDYICLLDPDTMFLHPHQQAWIEEIVEKHGDKWDLLGCMTNRVGVTNQLFEGKYRGSTTFKELNVFNHILNEKDCRKELDNIKETNLIAGFFMLFKRSLWDKIKFEQGIDFDIKFCNAVKKSGGRIGIMQGVYLWHSYRLLSDNPTKYKKHLL